MNKATIQDASKGVLHKSSIMRAGDAKSNDLLRALADFHKSREQEPSQLLAKLKALNHLARRESLKVSDLFIIPEEDETNCGEICCDNQEILDTKIIGSTDSTLQEDATELGLDNSAILSIKV